VVLHNTKLPLAAPLLASNFRTRQHDCVWDVVRCDHKHGHVAHQLSRMAFVHRKCDNTTEPSPSTIHRVGNGGIQLEIPLLLGMDNTATGFARLSV
jgi:hypothetical protein